MEAPFRVGEAPGYTFIEDAKGTRFITMVTRIPSTEIWLEPELVKKRAEAIAITLNRHPKLLQDL